jgi:hypothetical protein
MALAVIPWYTRTSEAETTWVAGCQAAASLSLASAHRPGVTNQWLTELLAYIIKMRGVAIGRHVPIRDCLAVLQGTIQYHTWIDENIALLLQRLPSSGNLAATPENGDDLGLLGKGPRTVGFPYISYI